ncbi:MAG: signal peptidase I [Bacteroidota bacterium]
MRILKRLGVLAGGIIVGALALIYVQFNWVGLIWVSGSSMEPTLHAGEVRVIWRTTAMSSLQRGCIAVFRRDQNNVKRVLGMPGDTVQVRDGQVYINQVMADTFSVIAETHAGSGSLMLQAQRVYNESWNAATWGPFVVPYQGMVIPLGAPWSRQYHTLMVREWNALHPEEPVEDMGQIPNLGDQNVFREDHYFLVGDNRIVSLDSRGYGPLPESACRGVISHL